MYELKLYNWLKNLKGTEKFGNEAVLEVPPEYL